MKFEFQAIGSLESCYKERFGTPRQSLLVPDARAKLKIRSDLQPEFLLSGLQGFSHVWLLFVFHENSNKNYYPKVKPPRLEGEKQGVYATRSPHRPSPIGLSLVRLEKIEGNTLFFAGVDLLDGTPILDIKPYVKEVDCQIEAKSGWVDELKPKGLSVEWTPKALEILRELSFELPVSIEEYQRLLADTLSLDPRPLNYKNSDTDFEYGLYLYNTNVHFMIQDRKAVVDFIEIAKK